MNYAVYTLDETSILFIHKYSSLSPSFTKSTWLANTTQTLQTSPQEPFLSCPTEQLAFPLAVPPGEDIYVSGGSPKVDTAIRIEIIQFEWTTLQHQRARIWNAVRCCEGTLTIFETVMHRWRSVRVNEIKKVHEIKKSTHPSVPVFDEPTPTSQGCKFTNQQLCTFQNEEAATVQPIRSQENIYIYTWHIQSIM